MSFIQNEAEVVTEGRALTLKDDEKSGLKVTASLRDQQMEKLAAKLDELDIGPKVVQIWRYGDADRSEWLQRQSEYLNEIDEFINPIYEPALDWSSTLHLPTILTVCKTYHSRMMQALWGIDPPFVCRSRTAANEDRSYLIEELMRYTLRDWCNEYDGVEEELDKWLWDWITKGDGVLKGRWSKKFTRFEDIETEQTESIEMQMDSASGQSVPRSVLSEIEKPVVKTIEAFNGPMLEKTNAEDILVVGGEGDPQKADEVIEQTWLTASELWSFVDQGVFRRDVVEEAVKGGKDILIGNDQSSNIKQQKMEMGGRSLLNREIELDRYRVFEAYMRVDVDGSGISSDVVVWVHSRTMKILRATYLRRIMPSGRRPYFRIPFHKRHGVEYSVGLPEMLYSLGKEIDAMHNIKIDVGILSSMPFGFYRPTSSSLKEESLPIEPGALIPVDNPQGDVMFPNLGVRTAFGFQEHEALMNQVERLTSISEINLGLQSGQQGAARTATGARALLGEASNNLTVYIARMNRGWKKALRYVFEMLQQRLPPGFQFRITGDDGNAYWHQVHSREEICGMYDFELDANSANSNKQVQQEQANMILQLTSDPINLQLGIVTPSNRYEAVVNMLKANGIKSIAKYATKPQQYLVQFSPLEILDRILMGVDVPLNPTMDLQGLIRLIQEFHDSDDLNGQFGPDHMGVLMHKAQEASQLLKAMQSAQANAQVAQQQNLNTRASMQPGNMQPAMLQQPTSPGTGGDQGDNG